MAYLYHGYVETLAKRFVANLSTVKAEHNFEYGSEFELVLCRTFRSALPGRVGVARGYVVSADGTVAGDDIILFERSRFPTLVLREQDDYSRKEYVPVEATYCYIEAKHTLNLLGDDPQSLEYACKQSSQVKAICSKRAPMPPNQILPHVTLNQGMRVTVPENFPGYLNPAFTVIFARQVRHKKGEPAITNPNEVNSILKSIRIPTAQTPDLMILGESNIVFPKIPIGQGEGARVSSPFFIPNLSVYHSSIVEGIAFGIGLITIMWAIDLIQLGAMPWPNIVADAFGLPLTGHVHDP